MFFLKKTKSSKKENIFFYLFSMQLFSADTMVFSKKNLKYFFDSEKVKKQASKVAHNRPRPFYFTVQTNGPQPRIDFSYYEISGPCSLICDLNPILSGWICIFTLQFFSFLCGKFEHIFSEMVE